MILNKSKLKKILTLERKRKKNNLKKKSSKRKMKTFDQKNKKINFFKKYGSICENKNIKDNILKKFCKDIQKPKKFKLKSLKKKISKDIINLKNHKKKKIFNKITKNDLKILNKIKKEKFPVNLKRYTIKYTKKDF